MDVFPKFCRFVFTLYRFVSLRIDSTNVTSCENATLAVVLFYQLFVVDFHEREKPLLLITKLFLFFCRWCFHEREKPLLVITKSFLFYWGALILLLMFSRAGKGASINYKNESERAPQARFFVSWLYIFSGRNINVSLAPQVENFGVPQALRLISKAKIHTSSDFFVITRIRYSWYERFVLFFSRTVSACISNAHLYLRAPQQCFRTW